MDCPFAVSHVAVPSAPQHFESKSVNPSLAQYVAYFPTYSLSGNKTLTQKKKKKKLSQKSALLLKHQRVQFVSPPSIFSVCEKSAFRFSLFLYSNPIYIYNVPVKSKQSVPIAYKFLTRSRSFISSIYLRFLCGSSIIVIFRLIRFVRHYKLVSFMKI